MDTRKMPQFFELVIIAFLLLISIELLLIHRDLMRKQGRGIPHGDETPGQTINVNVGNPGSASTPVAISPEQIGQKKDQALVMESANLKNQETPVEPPIIPPQPASASSASLRATSSGIVARKCPQCNLENSSYRNECFNCGEKL